MMFIGWGCGSQGETWREFAGAVLTGLSLLVIGAAWFVLCFAVLSKIEMWWNR
jgi:hypothetical protein